MSEEQLTKDEQERKAVAGWVLRHQKPKKQKEPKQKEYSDRFEKLRSIDKNTALLTLILIGTTGNSIGLYLTHEEAQDASYYAYDAYYNVKDVDGRLESIRDQVDSIYYNMR